jgi:hypothetical protein
MSYHLRRLAQHRKWFGENRKSLPRQAEIVIAELLAMNDTADECIRKQLSEITQLKARDNPDRLHDQHQDGTRLELRSDKRYRARRLEWEGQ